MPVSAEKPPLSGVSACPDCSPIRARHVDVVRSQLGKRNPGLLGLDTVNAGFTGYSGNSAFPSKSRVSRKPSNHGIFGCSAESGFSSVPRVSGKACLTDVAVVSGKTGHAALMQSHG